MGKCFIRGFQMNKFMKKLVGFSIGPILGAIISFVTVPITTFFISPSEYGKASMFGVIQSLVVTLVYLGIDQSYTREYHYEEDKKKLFQNALLLPLAASIIIGLIIIIFDTQFSFLLFDSGNYSEVSKLFALMILSSVLERFILLSIRMEEKAIEYSFFSVFVKVTILIVTILLLSRGYRDFMTVVSSTIFGQLLGDAILIYRYRHLFIFNKSYFDKLLLKKMFLFGVPLIVAASVSNLLNISGRLFLRGFTSYHDLGIYNAALKISNLLQIIQAAFTSFWVPTAYRWHKENRDIEQFSFIGDALLLAMTLVFFGLLIFKKVVVVILSSGYSDSQYIIGLLAMAPILYTLSETSTLGIVFSGKSYLNLSVSFLSIIPNLILNYLLVPIYGTIGAGISTACSYMVFCLARTYFSKKVGFNIEFKKQILNMFIFLVAAFVNSSSNTWVFPITVMLLIVSLLSQISTVTTFLNIKNNHESWDFS